jgi:hypothetical protein
MRPFLATIMVPDLRSWVTGWYDDLALRLAADLTDDEVPDDPD